jgi:hypothetical protein
MKSKRLKQEWWDMWHTWGRRDVYKILVGKPEGK